MYFAIYIENTETNLTQNDIAVINKSDGDQYYGKKTNEIMINRTKTNSTNHLKTIT